LSGFVDIWSVLGIASTNDETQIRRAYARRLKETHPEDDAEGFQRLRRSYEFALQLARHEAFAGTDAAGVPPEDTAHDRVGVQESPAAEVDAGRAHIEQLLADLGGKLNQSVPDTPGAAQALDDLFTSLHLERLDLLQRAESGVARILLQSIPRSDGLLDKADKFFGWSENRADTFRSPEAESIIARLGDRWLLNQLGTMRGAESKAFADLKAPPEPRDRFIRAYILHHSSFPELDVIAKLEQQNPALLEELNADNVAWWRRFESRPRISALTVAVALGFLLAATLLWYADADTPEGKTRILWWLPMGGGALLVLALFRYYVLEWGAIRLHARFHGQLPTGARIGWLPGSVFSMLAVVAAGGSAFLEWVFAAISLFLALGAVLAAGPSTPVIVPDGPHPLRSRVVRIVFNNLFVIAWLAWLLAERPGMFTTPQLIAICAALSASGVARALQIDAFAHDFTVSEQRGACVILCGVAVALGIAAYLKGGDPALQPLLVVAVLACVVLRRSVKFSIEMPSFPVWPGVFGLLYVSQALRSVRDFGPSTASGSEDAAGALVSGATFLLVGVLIAAGRHFNVLRSASDS
jgi:hypothetical protein